MMYMVPNMLTIHYYVQVAVNAASGARVWCMYLVAINLPTWRFLGPMATISCSKNLALGNSNVLDRFY